MEKKRNPYQRRSRAEPTRPDYWAALYLFSSLFYRRRDPIPNVLMPDSQRVASLKRFLSFVCLTTYALHISNAKGNETVLILCSFFVLLLGDPVCR